MKQVKGRSVIPLACAGVVALGTTWLAVGQEGSSLGRFFAATSGTGNKVAKRNATKQIYRSKSRYRREQNQIRLVQNRPRPRRPKPRVDQYTPVSLHVVNAKHVPVTGVPISLAIANHKGQVTRVVRNTDARGNVNLSKVGPLPADIKVYSGSPKWQLANANSARFEVERLRRAQLPEEKDARGERVLLASLNLTEGLLPVSANSGNRPDHYVMMKRVQTKLLVKAPPQARISSPAFLLLPAEEAPKPDPQEEEALSVPETGVVEAELPAESTEAGAVPITVSQQLPGGVAEAVIESYSTQEEEQTVAAPPLRLASVNAAQITQDLDVLSTEKAIKEKLGNPKKHKITLSKEKKDGDYSEWWLYEKASIAFKMRRMALGPDTGKTVNAAERVRLLGAGAGKIGNVTVGSSREEVIEQWGEPQVQGETVRPYLDTLFAKGEIDSYLDGGLRVCYVQDKVAWIDIARLRQQLIEGTTTFVPRSAARLYVKSFQGNSNPHCSIKNIADFKHFLSRSPAVVVVDDEEDAELTISAEVLFTEADQDKFLGIVPQKYECTTTLRYSLDNAITGKVIAQDKLVTGNAEVNLKKDLALGGIGSAILGKILGGEAAAVGVVATFIRARNKIKKASASCPGISVRQAFNTLTQDVSDAADFGARITDIDYEKGLLTLNVGSDMGVRPSTPEQPFEFQVAVADTPLGDTNSKNGRKVNYYVAVVRSVDARSSICEFQHVQGVLQGENNVIPSRPDLKILSRLPDPASGLISAQATVNFPEVEVYSDSELDEMEAQLKQQEKAPQP